MTALSWVTVKDPVAYLSDALNALPVFATKVEENKVPAEFIPRSLWGHFRTQEPEHKKLVDCLKLLMRALRSFVAENYAQGLFGTKKVRWLEVKV